MKPTVSRDVHFYYQDPKTGGEPYSAKIVRSRFNQEAANHRQRAHGNGEKLEGLPPELAPYRPADDEWNYEVNLAILRQREATEWDYVGDPIRYMDAVPFSAEPKVGHWSWPPRV